MSGLVLELGYLALYTVELPLDLCFSWSSFGIFVSTTERWVRLVLAMEVSIDTKTFTSINFSADMSIDIDTKLGDLTLAAPVQLPPPPPVHDRDPWPKEREGDPIPHFAHFDNPSTAVKSTECLNREIRDEWDNYDNMFYNEWLKVSIEPTRFVDPDVIRHMGIREDLEDMCMNLRSRALRHLVPRVEDIKALERELARNKREEERHAQLDRLGLRWNIIRISHNRKMSMELISMDTMLREFL
ncbi:hypothetical protein F2Q70_00011515 [Brassica cretica]|uniref:Uncharacterized protein n=1 Tax=Brassica cretica TaxID=69181 RepID=A0A8S9M4D5_BRACR|nr:hypothetical protein F2Q70_00011515 [Brassica cretica]